ncbi:hypothetical protein MSG28_005014 [Choristoneura fumiferana]|uniref:Uncharacterized protein n=1 Tax=Choristoneura fumiferana TaxID=7141 RepID=A0ACC0JPR4_CHOFU|nr:hypothetical protein MSG28_005014 [Choristoneura fumiferana]
MNHRILELYSGIGGMHCAWKHSCLPGSVVAAVDINTVANEVYRHNFPETNLMTRNIQSIKPEELKKLNMNRLPKDFDEPFALSEIIEDSVPDKHLVPDKLLKRANIFDVCYKDSRRSCCFTKAYTHYVEGTGSVFTDASPDTVDKCYKQANTHEVGSTEFVVALKEVRLRFFTPKEVSLLMAFPKDYDFPKNISTKQCYRLLGNSVNVKVISELLKILVT